MKLVVDASVGVKWFIPEKGSDRAVKLLEDHVNGEVELYAPDLFKVEVMNALRKYHARGVMSDSQLIKSLSILRELGLHLVEISWDLLRKALLRSVRGLTLYDSLYLVLAEELDADLVTADEKLYRFGGRVRLL